MKKKKSWTRPRHKVVQILVRPIFALICTLVYHARVERFREEGKRNWLVLSNHQTDFDQFFIGLAFRNPVYYVALEDLFSNGFVSKLIRWLVAPIPINKGSADPKAVMTCIRVAREGGSIALFPEGNRTYSGRTCNIKPSVAALAKKLGLPIAIFRIEGGYGVKPRWADRTRKGRMQAGVRRVIEPEEYQSMTKEELYALICRELQVDESVSGGAYESRTAAEGLERVLYVCPDCGMTEYDTEKDVLTCRRCRRQYRYGADKRLTSLSGNAPFPTVADWYDYQEQFVRTLDLAPYESEPVFTDTVSLKEVVVSRRKIPLMKNAQLRLYADRLLLTQDAQSVQLDFADVSAMACIAGHKLNIFHKDRIYQIRGGKHFNALKYCNIYYHAKFIREEHPDGEFQFLGL